MNNRIKNYSYRESNTSGKVVLVGNVETIKADAAKCGANIGGATIVDPKNFDNIDKYIDELNYFLKQSDLLCFLFLSC